MIDTGGEVDLGGLERIVCGEMYGKKEDTARVRRVALLKAVCQPNGCSRMESGAAPIGNMDVERK